MREEQFGTLTIRFPINDSKGRTRWITLRKFPYVSRDSCDAEMEIFFEDNPTIARRNCAVEWVYSEALA